MRAYSAVQDSANNYGSIVFETLVNYSLHIYTIYQLECKHCPKDKISKITTPLRLRINNHRTIVLHKHLKHIYVENNKLRLLNNN